MVEILKVCSHCGEEYSEQWGHECEGTRREAAEQAALMAEAAAAYAAQNAEIDAKLDAVLDELIERELGVDLIHDAVHHPKHYTSHPSGVECIDITKHYNFQIGNAMKYLWRQGLKNENGLDPVEKQIQDCEKAIWYIQSYINDLKGN